MHDWKKYYETNKNRATRALAMTAVGFVNNKRNALDLGAGALQETRFFVEQGFHVTAIDADPAVLEFGKQFFKEGRAANISQTGIENFEFKTSTYDFIWSYNALPFLDKENFQVVLLKIISALVPGGIFAGTFFGIKDSWNTPDRKMTFVSQKDIEEIFQNEETIQLNEMEEDKALNSGVLKHWHVYRVIVRKKQ